MIVPVTITDKNGHKRKTIGIVVTEIFNESAVKELRNALLDVLASCVSSEETKECTSSMSLWLLIKLIEAITPDSQEGGATT